MAHQHKKKGDGRVAKWRKNSTKESAEWIEEEQRYRMPSENSSGLAVVTKAQ
jgi:hypothetical protein